jgi:hypothetical protein
MLAQVRSLFDDATGTAELRAAARRLYLRQFSYAAARSAFALAAHRATRGSSGALPVSERFATFFDQVYRAQASVAAASSPTATGDLAAAARSSGDRGLGDARREALR